MKKLLLALVLLLVALVGLMALFPEETTRLAINAER